MSAPNADYVRQLEDACLILTAEMPGEQILLIRRETPALADFLNHLHHHIEHEQAMVRRNVWSFMKHPLMAVWRHRDGT